MSSEKHSMSLCTRVTNTDEIRREQRHPSSRSRRPQPHFLLPAEATKLSMGRGRRKMPSAEQRQPCSYRGLERIRLGLSLGSRAVRDVGSGCRHSCSVVYHALRISINQYVASVKRNTMGHVGDGQGGHSSAAGASDQSPPSTPAAPAPASAAPAAPCGPAVTTVNSGSYDDFYRRPNTCSSTTGHSTTQ